MTDCLFNSLYPSNKRKVKRDEKGVTVLKIKDGKLYGSNYAFALPEGFNRVVGADCFSDDDLVFESVDNDYLAIVIYFEKESHSAKNDLQKMLDDNSYLVKMSDFISIKRGKGAGIGLYFENTFGATQHYVERYDFKKNKNGETQIFIDISLWSGRKKDRQTIQEVLELPKMKAFLERIEYF